ncbi:hypothetical protein [Luteimicrobium album]|uniref:hypothetical protein n=1 Tax=Luteimicrobium album TaxID=1054550 RepID=UPI0024E0B8A2|nr:hypothetical protein [Luteimicrobium album]
MSFGLVPSAKVQRELDQALTLFAPSLARTDRQTRCPVVAVTLFDQAVVPCQEDG